MPAVFTAFIALALLALAGCAGDPDPVQTIRDRHFYDGLAAFNSARYGEAATHWGRAAEFGDVEAARNLGHLYRQGLGVEQDAALALAWYQVAADAGLSSAQYNLGMLYLNGGNNVAKDRLAGLLWLNRAAAGGIEPARKELERLAGETRAEQARAPTPVPVSSPAASPPTAAPAASPALLRLQIGSYRSAEIAETDWRRLRRGPEIGHEIVANRDRGDGRWFRLLAVGEPAALEAYCADIARRGGQCWRGKTH